MQLKLACADFTFPIPAARASIGAHIHAGAKGRGHWAFRGPLALAAFH